MFYQKNQHSIENIFYSPDQTETIRLLTTGPPGKSYKQTFYLPFRYILLCQRLLVIYSISILSLFIINGIPILLAASMCSKIEKKKQHLYFLPPLKIGMVMRHRTGQCHGNGICCCLLEKLQNRKFNSVDTVIFELCPCPFFLLQVLKKGPKELQTFQP